MERDEYKEEGDDHEKGEGAHGMGNIGKGEELCGEWGCGGGRGESGGGECWDIWDEGEYGDCEYEDGGGEHGWETWEGVYGMRRG